MNASEALNRLKHLGVPLIATADAAVALEQTISAATRTLTRLSNARLITSVRHGEWWVDGAVQPLRLPELLTTPMPSYVSLLTSLHYRGLIEQIPEVIYAVSLARTQRLETKQVTLSIHHVAPEVFGGFEVLTTDVKMATSEKALFDVAYLSAGRSRLFSALPELEIPRGFRQRELERWIKQIPSARSRTITRNKLEQLLGTSGR